EDRRIGPEAPPPEGVGQQRHAVIAPSLVGGAEVASERRRDAQRAQELRRHDEDSDALGLLAARQVEGPRVERSQRLEGTVPTAVLVEVRPRRGPGPAVLVP